MMSGRLGLNIRVETSTNVIDELERLPLATFSPPDMCSLVSGRQVELP